jgi:tRNA1Val (adenine37-N6)-methyltransferase
MIDFGRSSKEAREYFPRGLQQPEHGFRFSVDALLLACFAKIPTGARLLDMGAGCGVVGLGCLLHCAETRPDCTRTSPASLISLDMQPEMLGCCEANFRSLGLEGQASTVHCRVEDVVDCPELGPESVDVVVCNPPYRRAGSGKASPRADRELALAESRAGLVDFLEATAYVLKNRASAFFVFTAQRLTEFIEMASRCRLQVKTLRFVHGRQDAQAKTVLIQVTKNGRPDVVVQPPLVLYGQQEGRGEPNRRAVEFCPYLKT